MLNNNNNNLVVYIVIAMLSRIVLLANLLYPTCVLRLTARAVSANM